MSIDAPLIRRVLFIATFALAAAGWADRARADDAGDVERVRQAITYLDGRQEAWFEFNSAKRGQGADRTTCISCHTGITYAMTRPALGRFTAAPGAADAEARMLSAVGLRVENWADLDSPRFRLMYDHDERKKVEARGTEAVIDALILARDDSARRRTQPSDALRNALRYLWTTQATEGSNAGSWEWLNFGLEPWEAEGSRAFGASLAAIAVGTAPGYLASRLDETDARGVALLRDYLRRRFPEESLYNQIWILEAANSFEGLISADQRREVVDQVLKLQHEDGGWALADLGAFKRVDGSKQVRDSDGYATGLILHALRLGGIPATRPELAKALAWLRAHQRPDGSWPGRSVNKERDPATMAGKLMTDAATAFAAMALAETDSPRAKNADR